MKNNKQQRSFFNKWNIYHSKIPDLAERLKTVDLEDANQLWAALTNTEKQEFEATLRNGEAINFLPQWIPWWSDVSERKIIQEIVDDNVEPEYVANCPKIVDVPAFNELMVCIFKANHAIVILSNFP